MLMFCLRYNRHSISAQTLRGESRINLRTFLNHLVVTVWMDGSEKIWYVEYVTDLGKDENTDVTVDHLHRVSPQSHHLWEYPKREDKLGEWTMNLRNKLTLKNWTYIKAAVQQKVLQHD